MIPTQPDLSHPVVPNIHKQIMRFSQVNILMGMTLSGMLAVASVPAHADTSQLACSLRPWITIIPLNFMFGLLFGKTWRIFRLMNNKHLKALKIKESWVVFVAFLLTVPELLIHGIYFIIAPPEVARACFCGCNAIARVVSRSYLRNHATSQHDTTHTDGARADPQ